MKQKRKKRRIPKRMAKWIVLAFSVAIVAALGTGIILFLNTSTEEPKRRGPEELLAEYMSHMEKREYEAMHAMLDEDSAPTMEAFAERYTNIYEGIEAQNFVIKNMVAGEQDGKVVTVTYDTAFDTIAGQVEFENHAAFLETENGYKLLWRDGLILPDLSETDKVKVTVSMAERGEILDRNGKVLAGWEEASSVGIVPGKLENREESLAKLAALLEIDAETIEEKLAADWVQENSFVPIVTIPKAQKIDLMTIAPDESAVKEHEREEQLLAIPGVMLTDANVRFYALGEAAAHLIGYVQTVTAEDLEEHPGEGYYEDSVIGKTGIESLYEKELKGQNGCRLSIVTENGDTKEVLADIPRQNGQNIRLTIDSELQKTLYEQFKEERGCSVAIQPYTGEVLALVSTPSYNNNEFIKGISEEKWTSLNEDENKPLYNRFRQAWCPGSTLKPIVAGIGLETRTVDPNEDFGAEGLTWQKDESWGLYKVSTIKEYEPVIMKNALRYSDNIYFAKVALRIGADSFGSSLDKMGFNQELPFEIVMSQSQYSNTDKIETEIQLADSGYGQGQILVNPLHLASIYTAFLNGGNVIKPRLLYQEQAEGEVWIPGVFSPENVNVVMEGMKAVVNEEDGTGHLARREDMVLAGKTGTAETKATKEDEDGAEIGWFAVFTTEKQASKPILIISMVENVKEIGGTTYVIERDKAVMDTYFSN